MPQSFDAGLDALKAIAEPTRLRLLALLRHGDLSVKDLTNLLGQSQPRLSRHLKLLSDAGWITRFPEGSWVYYRMSEDAPLRVLWAAIFELFGPDNQVLRDDGERLARLKNDQQARAQSFFDDHAASWDALRADLVPEGEIEAAILRVLGDRRVRSFLDIGTGTGRLLVLLQALYAQGVGVDPSHAMLQVARATLAKDRVDHAQVRHGDGLALGLARDSQDLVALHQVMHFFDDPRVLLSEARRVLAPSGRLLVVDFAPHRLEALRTEHQHRRLGFDGDEVSRWLEALGLSVEPLCRLANAASSAQSALPVHIWVAHDRRIQLDAPAVPSSVAFA